MRTETWLLDFRTLLFQMDVDDLGALYENEYVKEDGKWKIKILRYRPQWHATFEKGIPHPSPSPDLTSSLTLFPHGRLI